MSRRGNCSDNAPMESFFGSLKTDSSTGRGWALASRRKAAVFECIEIFHSHCRRLSSIGYRTPAQARVDMTMAHAAWRKHHRSGDRGKVRRRPPSVGSAA
jgi:putative transposase